MRILRQNGVISASAIAARIRSCARTGLGMRAAAVASIASANVPRLPAVMRSSVALNLPCASTLAGRLLLEAAADVAFDQVPKPRDQALERRGALGPKIAGIGYVDRHDVSDPAGPC